MNVTADKVNHYRRSHREDGRQLRVQIRGSGEIMLAVQANDPRVRTHLVDTDTAGLRQLIRAFASGKRAERGPRHHQTRAAA
jgi:hypothetical protein